MTAHDDWLQKPYLDQEARDQAIDNEIDRLLETDYNPAKVKVFMDAIDNNCLYADQEKLAEILNTNAPWEELGRYVFKAVQTYCVNSAIQEAQTIINLG
jgi:uncharacterized protein (DUF1778 family)